MVPVILLPIGISAFPLILY